MHRELFMILKHHISCWWIKYDTWELWMIMPGTFLFSLTFWQHSFGYIFLHTNRKYTIATNGHHNNTKICIVTIVLSVLISAPTFRVLNCLLLKEKVIIAWICFKNTTAINTHQGETPHSCAEFIPRWLKLLVCCKTKKLLRELEKIENDIHRYAFWPAQMDL